MLKLLAVILPYTTALVIAGATSFNNSEMPPLYCLGRTVMERGMVKTVELAAGSDVPLYKQLEQSFIADIVAGKLKPGDPVPSTYTLAEQFGISRVTAVRCYEELKGRGFLSARRGGCTVVNPQLVLQGTMGPLGNSEPTENSRFDNRLGELLQKPPAELVPVKAWLKTMQTIFDSGGQELSSAGQADVVPRLRNAVAAFLLRARGISSYPRNILLFDTKWQAIGFIVEHFLDVGDAVAVENPGDPLLFLEFSRRSLQLKLMSVDREGAAIEDLEPSSGVKIIAVSPSAQNPTGVMMSERRRQQLARYAGHNQAILLEDDAAALLRYGKNPEPSLYNKFLDAIHLGSFGTYMGSLCQLTYLVVPDRLLDRLGSVVDARAFSQPKMEHTVLLRMIDSGALELAIFRQRTALSKRRQELMTLLVSELRDFVSMNAGATGYELLLRFKSTLPRNELISKLADCGIELNSLERCYIEPNRNQRVEILLPLMQSQGSACNSIEQLLAVKRQLMTHATQDFAPPADVGAAYMPPVFALIIKSPSFPALISRS